MRKADCMMNESIVASIKNISRSYREASYNLSSFKDHRSELQSMIRNFVLEGSRRYWQEKSAQSKIKFGTGL